MDECVDVGRDDGRVSRSATDGLSVVPGRKVKDNNPLFPSAWVREAPTIDCVLGRHILFHRVVCNYLVLAEGRGHGTESEQDNGEEASRYHLRAHRDCSMYLHDLQVCRWQNRSKRHNWMESRAWDGCARKDWEVPSLNPVLVFSPLPSTASHTIPTLIFHEQP